MIDFSGELLSAAASARRISGNDRPPRAKPPIRKKLRRWMPSQNGASFPGIVSRYRIIGGWTPESYRASAPEAISKSLECLDFGRAQSSIIDRQLVKQPHIIDT